MKVIGSTVICENGRKIGQFSGSENKFYVNERFFKRVRDLVIKTFKCNTFVLQKERW